MSRGRLGPQDTESTRLGGLGIDLRSTRIRRILMKLARTSLTPRVLGEARAGKRSLAILRSGRCDNGRWLPPHPTTYFGRISACPRSFAIRKGLRDKPDSDFLSAWDFTADPCTFPGVDALILRLGRLSELVELSLVPGRVTGPIPDAFSGCSELRFLALTLRLVPGVYRLSLLKLSNLILCHNQLSGSIPPFPASSPLLRLDLKHNQLSGPVPPLPPSLRYLSLGSNALTVRVEAVLPRRIRLNFLDLSSNFLEGPIHLQRSGCGAPPTAQRLLRSAGSPAGRRGHPGGGPELQPALGNRTSAAGRGWPGSSAKSPGPGARHRGCAPSTSAPSGEANCWIGYATAGSN
ncbi:hypothetical protein ZIOFF_071677 [Zingiber officinale]|uniref:Uncharacterized protein n=1 Tax=Zingiber officinale TaxID=94328 RepID=A0A8J5C1T8_ZINOF|nr:hypothetical protein ZIOFF_071677 [Zingiber officinale]